jgi:ABC-2 type transport system ATP-binding protein
VNDSPAIVVDQLSKTYRDGGRFRYFGRSVQALKGVSFQVPQGEVFGLLGPNGAGKTTFIKILLGIVRETAGSATLLGSSAGDRLSRRRVGYLPEQLRMPFHQTAHTALQFYGQLSGLRSRRIAAVEDAILETVGLADWKNVSVRKYSKGMLQRLGLAQALLHDPDLLILDEPTDGLDPLGRSQVRSILAELKRQNKTVFLNSHLLQEVELICDRVAILDRGSLRFVGPLAEITKTQATEICFDLAGPERAIEAALAGRACDRWEKTADDRFHIELALENQADVDACIDGLRAQGISVIELSRRSLTLEDAFLQLLTEEPKPA